MTEFPSSTDLAGLRQRAELCAKYDFDTVEMIECKWALWDDILEALNEPVGTMATVDDPRSAPAGYNKGSERGRRTFDPAQRQQVPDAWQARRKGGEIWTHCEFPNSNPDYEYRPLYAAPQPASNATMARLSASEAACYRWPEDTAEHRAMRAAYMDGAGHVGGDAYEVARHIIGYLEGNCGLSFTDVKQDDWDTVTRLVATLAMPSTQSRTVAHEDCLNCHCAPDERCKP